MAPLTVTSIDELRDTVGKTIGPSEWREVSQEMIDTFADLSGDHQWIHVDRERAKAESPFGTTIAHGNSRLPRSTASAINCSSPRASSSG